MNNYCENCGNKLESNAKVCSKCGAEVLEIGESTNSTCDVKNIVHTSAYKKKENIYVIIVIFLFLLSVFVPSIDDLLGENSIFSAVSPWLTISPLTVVIFAKFEMPDSKKIKLLYFAIGIIALVYFTKSMEDFYDSLSNCG